MSTRRRSSRLDVATWEKLFTAGEAMGLARVQAQAIAGPVAD